MVNSKYTDIKQPQISHQLLASTFKSCATSDDGHRAKQLERLAQGLSSDGIPLDVLYANAKTLCMFVKILTYATLPAGLCKEIYRQKHRDSTA